MSTPPPLAGGGQASLKSANPSAAQGIEVGGERGDLAHRRSQGQRASRRMGLRGTTWQEGHDAQGPPIHDRRPRLHGGHERRGLRGRHRRIRVKACDRRGRRGGGARMGPAGGLQEVREVPLRVAGRNSQGALPGASGSDVRKGGCRMGWMGMVLAFSVGLVTGVAAMSVIMAGKDDR